MDFVANRKIVGASRLAVLAAKAALSTAIWAAICSRDTPPVPSDRVMTCTRTSTVTRALGSFDVQVSPFDLSLATICFSACVASLRVRSLGSDPPGRPERTRALDTEEHA